MRAHLANPSYGLTWRAALQLGSEGSMAPRRNKIINGEMRIDQQWNGNNPFVNSATVTRSVDKWNGFGTAAAGVFTLQRTTAGAPAGFTHFLRAMTTTADAAPAGSSTYFLWQSIEGTLMADLQFGLAVTKYITLSFKVRSSLTGTFSGFIRNAGGSRSLVFVFSITAANTWTDISIVLPVDLAGTWATDTTAGLLVGLDLGSGAANRIATPNAWQAANYTGETNAVRLISTLNATFDLTAVQLEAGTLKSEFERVPLDMELRHCQREYFKTFDQDIAPAQNVGENSGELHGIAGKAGAVVNYGPFLRFPVVMRADPIITYFNPSAANSQMRDIVGGGDFTGTATTRLSNSSLTVSGTGHAGLAVGNLIAVHLTADARL